MPNRTQFWDRLVPSGDCWIYVGAMARGGYGRVKVGGSEYRAHRYAWLTLRGEIPDGLDLDHLCRNRACVNPDHLDPVPSAVNKSRGLMGSGNCTTAVQTHCKRDHEFTPDNTYMWRGRRKCRACQRIYNAARKS